MTKPWDHIETNPEKVKKALAEGPLSTIQLCRRAGLGTDECRYALLSLTMERKVEFRNKKHQLIATQHAQHMVSRVWNKSVFAAQHD